MFSCELAAYVSGRLYHVFLLFSLSMFVSGTENVGPSMVGALVGKMDGDPLLLMWDHEK